MIEVEPLLTILKIETRKGYDNSTVAGGLDRFLSNWAGKSTDKSCFPEELEYLRNSADTVSYYASIDRHARKKFISCVMLWLEGISKNKESKRKTGVQLSSNSKSDSGLSEIVVGIESPVTVLKGIKSGMAARLGRLEIKTIRDILYFFPRRHVDYTKRRHISEISVGDDQTVVGSVWESKVTNFGTQKGTEVTLADETGTMRAVWFNQPYLAKKFATNTRLILSGKVSNYRDRLVFESPEWDIFEDQQSIHAGSMVPVYALSRGLYQRQIRTLIKRTVDLWISKLEEFLPEQTRKRCQLMDLKTAIKQAHFPEDQPMNDGARKRLAFDEFLLIQLGVLSKKHAWQESQPGNAFNFKEDGVRELLNSLPFKLTGAQDRVLKEIIYDLRQPRPMSRLLQGEVGSGKTIVAVFALLTAVNAGYQGALMAPTEILAEQHFTGICNLLRGISSKYSQDGNVNYFETPYLGRITVSLLTGKMNRKEKSDIYENLKENNIDIAIGTHALIQKGVEFGKLGLVIIDEQHRFGVLQRSAMRQKGFNPHLLVMTATPIPRTLAMTLYGDLDISVIDELPPGRQAIKTRWLKTNDRDQAYEFIRHEIKCGHQAFIICPLIEESDTIEAKAATVEYERLSREVFPEFNLGLLHGKITPENKDRVMRQFRDATLDILVSTPVVEVGIDVPNATVMLIEAANRFGLSQLHQFRGRVGRGKSQSYCLLLSENPTDEGMERLKAIEDISDGFTLAEKDLELRGPGEFFGTRQSGLPDLRMAKLSDVKLLESARKEAEIIYNGDPCLVKAENRSLALELARAWPGINEWS